MSESKTPAARSSPSASSKTHGLFPLIREFLRYTVVGGISFLVDLGVIYLVREHVFGGARNDAVRLGISVALGFLAGLLVNYLLSQLFVFTAPGQQERGRSVSAFARYAIIGIIGLGLTELLMLIGVRLVGDHGLRYLIVKAFVAGIVLIWNYAGRRLWIYQEKSHS
ncbi:MAG: GtrA family protein [Bacillota bacterium]|nr:GtrA family protein [Bacillota bacterium]